MLERYYFVYWNEPYDDIKLALDEVIKKKGVTKYLTGDYRYIMGPAEETTLFVEGYLVDWEVIEFIPIFGPLYFFKLEYHLSSASLFF